MGKKYSLRRWFRRFGVQLPLFFLGTGLAVILVLSGAIYFFAANLLMDETVSKTHELMELSGTNLSTYIAHVKGESNVFASDPTSGNTFPGMMRACGMGFCPVLMCCLKTTVP